MSDHSTQNNDYQDREIRIKPLAIFLVATLAVTVLTIVGMKALFDSYSGQSIADATALVDSVMASYRPTNAVLEGMGDAAVAMQQMKAEVDAALNHYRWVDAGAGVVQIPVARAMEVLVEQGRLPARPAK